MACHLVGAEPLSEPILKWQTFCLGLNVLTGDKLLPVPVLTYHQLISKQWGKYQFAINSDGTQIYKMSILLSSKNFYETFYDKFRKFLFKKMLLSLQTVCHFCSGRKVLKNKSNIDNLLWFIVVFVAWSVNTWSPIRLLCRQLSILYGLWCLDWAECCVICDALCLVEIRSHIDVHFLEMCSGEYAYVTGEWEQTVCIGLWLDHIFFIRQPALIWLSHQKFWWYIDKIFFACVIDIYSCLSITMTS